MERLWLANIAPGTSDDEIRELVGRYAPGVECTEVKRVEGEGTSPGAILSFSGKEIDTLGKLKLRLDGLYWKGRALRCSTTVF